MADGKVVVVVDDASPQIQYITLPQNSNAWTTNFTDSYRDQFNLRSRHVTGGIGNFLSFTIRGSSITAYGSHGNIHGNYKVEIDDEDRGTFDGWNRDGLLMTLLYDGTNDDLDPSKDHTIVITDLGASDNVNGTRLDLDYLEVTYPVSGQVNTEYFDDTSPSFQWDSNWTPMDVDTTGWYENTSHTTTVPEASVTFTFTGSAIQLFGSTCALSGNYSIVLDNGPVQQFQAYDPFNTYRRVPLYTALGLNESQHTLVFRNKPTSQNTGSWIDYAVVNSTTQNLDSSSISKSVSSSSQSLTSASSSGAASATLAGPIPSSMGTSSSATPNFPDPVETTGSEGGSSGSSKSRGTSTGVIVGVSLVLAAAVGAVITGYHLWRRRRRDTEGDDHGWEEELVDEFESPKERSIIASWRRRRDIHGRL